MAFQLKVRVDPKLAIPAGNSEFGARTVEVTDELLLTCDEGVRGELILAYAAEGEEILGPLAIASWEAVHAELQARALRRRTAVAEATHRAIEEKKQQAEREAATVKLTLALHKWVGANGTDSQKARLKEGLLPHEEVLEMVRDELFAEFEGQDRYVPIRLAEFCECGEGVMQRTPATALAEDRYERLLEARNEAPKNATVAPYHHIGECKACRGDVSRDSLRVSVPWGGVTLHRDFAL